MAGYSSYFTPDEEEEDFDVNLSGTKMRSILIKAGLADTDIDRIMENVHKATRIRMMDLQDKARELEKRTEDFNFLATVDHHQVLEILQRAEVRETAIIRSLSGFDELAKQAPADQQNQPRQKVKDIHYWTVNCGHSSYYPPTDDYKRRYLLSSNDRDAVPSEITAGDQKFHVVVITKHWQTALQMLKKLKQTGVRIVYVEFIILERPSSRENFTSSMLVEDDYTVHEWAGVDLQTAIERHMEVNRTYPLHRGVKAVNMYPVALDVTKPRYRTSDERYPPHNNNRSEPSQYRDGPDVPSKRNGGGMAGYGYVSEPAHQSSDDYTARSTDWLVEAPSPRVDASSSTQDFGYARQPIPILSAEDPLYVAPSDNAPPSYIMESDEPPKKKRPQPEFKIPRKKARAPGGMDLH